MSVTLPDVTSQLIIWVSIICTVVMAGALETQFYVHPNQAILLLTNAKRIFAVHKVDILFEIGLNITLKMSISTTHAL